MPRFRWTRERVSRAELADRARDMRQWPLAARLYREALDRDPGNPGIWVQYGHALKEWGQLRDPAKLAQAETAYRRALSLAPGIADSYLQLGHVLKLQGKADEARAAYLRAVALDGSAPEPLRELNGLGWSAAQAAELQTLTRLEDAPAAVNFDTASLADAPQNPGTIPDRGSSRRAGHKASVIMLADRARDQRQWECAARLYRTALERNPRTPPIWVQYGHALKEAGKPAEAEAAYRRALALDPGVADTYLQLGHILKLQGKAEGAQAAYLRAFALEPSMPQPLHELGGLGWSQAHIAEFRGLAAAAPKPALPGPAAGGLSAVLQPGAETAGKLCGSALGGREGDVRAIRESGLFDEIYYRATNPDLPAGIDAVRHFVEFGAREGRMPNRLFDPKFYLAHNPALAQSGDNPLIHFIRRGAAEARQPHPDFDPAFYLAKYPDVVRSGQNPLSHYLENGEKEGRQRNATGAASQDYPNWVSLYDTIDDHDRRDIIAAIERMTTRPLISIVMPVYNTPEPYLRATIESVRQQLYPDWELCIADDASTSVHVRKILEHYRVLDSRIKVCYRPENGHISAASNSALALAEGSFVALLDHDDLLPEHALYMVANVLESDPEVDLIYSDEDKIDANGKRCEAYFKSDWNPDLMLSQNMFSHLGVYRRSLIERIGGFRSGYEGSQDYDLVLRAQRLTIPSRIRHLPHVLYHWRAIPGSVALRTEEKPYALATARRAIKDHLAECGITAEVMASPNADWHRVRYPLPEPVPRVTIIIPTRDRVDLLRTCVEGLLHQTDYSDFEILVVDNQSEEPATHAYFGQLYQDPRIRILPYDAPFNYSGINNFAVSQATGSLLCFLNNDTEVITRDWLIEMVSHALRPGIGAVGALLYYPDGRIQHGGVILGLGGGVAGHAHKGLQYGNYGYIGRARLIQNLSAVTAACLVMAKTVFDEVGGFNQTDLPVAYNDIDLCLRCREAGYRIVWTPYAELYHHESVSRGLDTALHNIERAIIEFDYMFKHWRHRLEGDPYYNPNLGLNGGGFELAFPPRNAKPWRRHRYQHPALTAGSGDGYHAFQGLQGNAVALPPATAVEPLQANFTAAPAAARLLVDAKLKFRELARKELETFLADGQKLRLPSAVEPMVSILLVLHNQAELSLHCLRTLIDTVDMPAEVIIVDNASSDDTGRLLDRLQGAQITRNSENYHFLYAVNQAAAEARGGALLLLNNDANLMPGTLQAALETLHSAVDIGAVGGKLTLPDGTLQEAGSIIWNDGTCAGYARGADPEAAECQFQREVDYCSGAFLLVRRDLFESLGRLDVVFAPAYYEETDLCMRIRQAGCRIIYNPRVEVRHFEFGSSSSSEEALSLMRRNHKLFVDRHWRSLARHHLPPQSPMLIARSSDRRRPRLLMIEDLVPFPSNGAGFPRASRILRAFHKAGCFITYYPVNESKTAWKEVHTEFPIEVEFMLGHGRGTVGEFLDARAGYYDVIVVCRRPNMEAFVKLFEERSSQYSGVSIIYETEALWSSREAMRCALTGTPMAAAAEVQLKKEVELARTADAVIAVNANEADVFKAAGHGNVHVIGHAIEPVPLEADFAHRRDFLFVGALYDDDMPNIDALFWFVDEVMPHLDRLLGRSYRVHVAGPGGSQRLRGLVNPRILVLGRVEDLTEHYRQARVFIAPTRFAAGIPHKIHETAARGLPAVATSLLATQLGWTDGAELLTADTPEDFAAQCARLYTDQALWLRLRKAALGKVTVDCDPADFDRKVAAVLASVGLPGRWSRPRAALAAKIAGREDASVRFAT